MAAEPFESTVRHERTSQEPQRGILFTGELVQHASPDVLAKLGELASSVGVEMRVIDDISQFGSITLADAETANPQPRVFTRKDFRAFASEHGFSATIANRTWARVADTANSKPRGYHNNLSPIQVVGPGIDLDSLYAHVADDLRIHGGFSTSEKQEKFLLTLLDEVLQPEVPLSKPKTTRL